MTTKSILRFGIFSLIIISAGCTKAIIDDLDPGGEVPEEVFYDPDVLTIMQNNCVTCHGGPAPNAGLDLTTYNNVRFATESSNLLERINSVAAPMPPGGRMPATERETIQQWADDGFPEN